jgi:hypothetical protein
MFPDWQIKPSLGSFPADALAFLEAPETRRLGTSLHQLHFQVTLQVAAEVNQRIDDGSESAQPHDLPDHDLFLLSVMLRPGAEPGRPGSQ